MTLGRQPGKEVAFMLPTQPAGFESDSWKNATFFLRAVLKFVRCQRTRREIKKLAETILGSFRFSWNGLRHRFKLPASNVLLRELKSKFGKIFFLAIQVSSLTLI